MTELTKLEILVKPSKKRFHIYKDVDGRIIAELTAPPTKGKANKELIQYLTKKLGCRVNLLKGHASTTKLLAIPLSPTELEKRLQNIMEADSRGKK